MLTSPMPKGKAVLVQTCSKCDGCTLESFNLYDIDRVIIDPLADALEETFGS